LLAAEDENPKALLAHLETCPDCRMIVESELAGEPLPLKKLPVLELPPQLTSAPQTFSAEPAKEKAEITYFNRFAHTFQLSLGPIGAVIALLVIGGFLFLWWPAHRFGSVGFSSDEIARIQRLSDAAAAAAGKDLPEPVFSSGDGPESLIDFASADFEEESEFDGPVVFLQVSALSKGVAVGEKPDTGELPSAPIRFLGEADQTVDFGNEERLPTFFEFNIEKEDLDNG